MLYYAPHTVTILAHEQQKSARRVANNITDTPSVSLKVCINSKDPQVTSYETGREYKRPHKMLMDIDDAPKVREGDKVKWGTRLFMVTTEPRQSVHGLPTDHASVMLEEVEQ